MIKPIMFSIAALGLCAAQSASAFEIEVLIEEGAFYPEITYLIPGDIVTFVNNNDGSVKVMSSDSTWESEDLGVGDSYVLAISPDTTLNFALESDPEIAGRFSFDLAPLGNADDLGEGDGSDLPESSN